MNQMDKIAGRDVLIVCPNCKASNTLGDCISELMFEDTVIEVGLECPECGTWTHSYWTNDELKTRAARLEEMGRIVKAKPTEAKWANYQTAREAYKKSFEEFQTRMKGKSKRREGQPA